MKKLVFILLVICLTGIACEKKEQSLKGTFWKLAGIMDVQTGILTELEPKDCEQCYTLIFIADDTLVTWSTTNSHRGIYNMDYKTNSFNIISLLGTLVGERGDGWKYVRSFCQVQSFSLKNKKKELKELWLYYDDEKKYLLFK